MQPFRVNAHLNEKNLIIIFPIILPGRLTVYSVAHSQTDRQRFMGVFNLIVFIICFIPVAFHHIIQGPYVSSIVKYNQLVSTEFKVFLLEVSYIWLLITLC